MAKKWILTKAYVLSHIGLHRSNHEDNYLLNGEQYIDKESQKNIKIDGRSSIEAEMKLQKKDITIFSVADGMGGHQAGEEASLMAVQLLKMSLEPIVTAPTIDGAVSKYQQFLRLLNERFLHTMEIHSRLRGMGTTLTSLIVHNGQAVAINVGDSRIYQFNKKGLKQLTTDHTVGQRLISQGKINSEELNKFPEHKHLNRFIGMGDKQVSLTGTVSNVIDINEKTWFLVCSDGLTDVLSQTYLNEILHREFFQSNIYKASECLIKEANKGNHEIDGGLDNITAMLIECVPLTKPFAFRGLFNAK